MGTLDRQRAGVQSFERRAFKTSGILQQSEKFNSGTSRPNRKFVIEFREKPLFALQEREKCLWVANAEHATNFNSKEIAIKFCKLHFLHSSIYKITEWNAN